jgi:hypothetical protein
MPSYLVRIDGRVYEVIEYHGESEIGWHFTLRCVETGKRSQWCFPKKKMVGDSLVYLMPPKFLELFRDRKEGELDAGTNQGTETKDKYMESIGGQRGNSL